jgi:hypothetical protein
MKIKIFVHIWAINHWYTVFTEQMRILLTSGLYDACEEISISLISSPAERYLFEMYFVDCYSKIKFKVWSEQPGNYEFPALRLIEADDSQYAGLYFHVKGVTRPFETVIQHWRSTLNEAILNQWQTHYQNILNGYDVSSVNFRQSPDHFSGNFWWFNREYIKRLPPVNGLDLTNRWHAEQYICMAQGKFWYPPFIEPGDNLFQMQYRP